MLDKTKIAAIVDEFLQGTDKFLVDVVVSKGNVVDVFVDGDAGISINECAGISRFIESNLDRDREDYELRVSSPGIDKPFRLKRQYARYVGREVMLVLMDGTRTKGTLLRFSGDELELEYTPDAKKKSKEVRTIAFADVRQGKPVISFK